MRYHKQHSEQLSDGKEAIASALNRFLEAREHFVSAAESAGVDAKYQMQERIGRGRRKLHRGRQNLEHLGEDAAHYARERPLLVIGTAVVLGLFLYQAFSRR